MWIRAKRGCWGHGSEAPIGQIFFRRLALLLALLASALASCVQAQTTQTGKRVALLIGNQDYKHERKLRNPVNDAELLGRVLKQDLKFDLVRVERNLDANGMDRVVEEFATQAKEAATVVFYYSGHGLTSPGDRRAYLLPTDARTGVPGAPKLDRQAVAAEAVRDRLRGLRAGITLLILDACRDGPGDGKSGSKGLARVGGANQLLVAYATEEGKTAADGDGPNSPYAEALARAWRRTDQSVLQQFDSVYDEVTRRVPDQQPTREGNLRADARLGGPPPASAPSAAATAQAVEQQAWEAAQRAHTVAGYRAYLDEFPAGRYAAAARVARAALQEPAAARPAEPRPVQVATAWPEPATPVRPAPAATTAAPAAGRVVKDCDVCPELVVIPAGTFQMGSNDGKDETPVRRVEVASFLLGRTEVTQGQWKAVMGSNPSHFKNCGDDCPVESVSWIDAQEYIKKLNEKTGQRYRLPSEAEWEYAARAGSKTRWSFGDDESALVNHAWFTRNSGGRTHAVAGKQANAFGLYDMYGNVWEWVVDTFHTDFQGAPSDGSAWVSGGDGALRVVRGGVYVSDPRHLRSAFRTWGARGSRSVGMGLRIARTF